MTAAAGLRARAEAEAQQLPPLLLAADRLAGAVLMGAHGRRRAGPGEDFWQYRPAQPGDSRQRIDPRRSGRGDQDYVRDREWQIAQTLLLAIDRGASMRSRSDRRWPEKSDRARVLGLALALVLLRGGERVGLAGSDLPPRRGPAQRLALAQALLDDSPEEFGLPALQALPPRGQAVILSDALGPLEPVAETLARAAGQGVGGVFLQVLDPAEEEYPFRGRVRFESPGGSLRHDTLQADGLRARYLERLAERRARLAELCARSGWLFGTHRTDLPAQTALIWLYHALGRGRR